MLTLMIVIVCWILLGVHSVWYFIKHYTKHYDLTEKEIGVLIVCFLIPIVTQIATFLVYHLDDNKIIIKKKDN